eukprot:1603798-Rhodomonas_salina.3
MSLIVDSAATPSISNRVPGTDSRRCHRHPPQPRPPLRSVPAAALPETPIWYQPWVSTSLIVTDSGIAYASLYGPCPPLSIAEPSSYDASLAIRLIGPDPSADRLTRSNERFPPSFDRFDTSLYDRIARSDPSFDRFRRPPGSTLLWCAPGSLSAADAAHATAIALAPRHARVSTEHTAVVRTRRCLTGSLGPEVGRMPVLGSAYYELPLAVPLSPSPSDLATGSTTAGVSTARRVAAYTIQQYWTS